MIAAFGVPIAFLAALVWGVPVLYVVGRVGLLRALTLVVAGSLGGTMVAAWLAFDEKTDLFRVNMPLAGGAALGALIGATWW